MSFTQGGAILPRRITARIAVTATVAAVLLMIGGLSIRSFPVGADNSERGFAHATPTDQTEAQPSGGTPYWSPLYSVTAPPSWGSNSNDFFAYDPAAGYDLLFMVGDTGFSAQTWTYENRTWTNITSSSGTQPSQVGPPIIYYPPARALQIRGYSGIWSFANGSWSFSAGQGVPFGGRWLLAYDASAGELVAFGGLTTLKCCWKDVTANDTWVYQSGFWVNLTSSLTTSPPENSFGADGLTYDPSLGGLLGYGPWTWEFTRGHWTNLTAVSGTPSDPQPIGLAYSSTYNLTIAQGSGTWAYGAQGWQTLHMGLEPRPNPVWGNLWAPMAPDPAGSGLVFLQGGCSSACVVSPTFEVRDPFELYSFTIGPVPPGPTIVSFGISPNPAIIGHTATISVVTAGGLGLATFAYLALPLGCVPTNDSNVSCVFRATGTYLVTVTATDLANRSDAANLTFSVVSSLGQSGSPWGVWMWFALGGAAGASATVAVGLAIRKRRSGQPPSLPPQPET